MLAIARSALLFHVSCFYGAENEYQAGFNPSVRVKIVFLSRSPENSQQTVEHRPRCSKCGEYDGDWSCDSKKKLSM